LHYNNNQVSSFIYLFIYDYLFALHIDHLWEMCCNCYENIFLHS